MKKCLIVTFSAAFATAKNESSSDVAPKALYSLLSGEKCWDVISVSFYTDNVTTQMNKPSVSSPQGINSPLRINSLENYTELLVKQAPDLIFMQVPNDRVLFNSLLREQLVKNTIDKGGQLICFSDSTEHACEALSMGALDFIQLPCSLKRLDDSLQKAKVFQSGLSSLQQHSARIIVKSVGNMEMIDIADILWVKGAANYAELHCKDRVVLHRETLASLESKLSLSSFARVHRSALVNWTKIKAITSELGRYSILKMINDEEVKLSVSYKEHLFARLGV